MTPETPTLAARAKAVRWRARQRWATHDSYLLLARRRKGRAVVGPDTEIVIEGFPRTGNTFAVFAFQSAQPRPVRVAHHLHAPAQVSAAAARGLPVLLLIRPPEDAIVSSVLWWPHVTPGDVLAAYTRFYERLLPVRDACVIGRFDDVTGDMGVVIDRVNRRFGCDFARFEHTPENVESCYRLIEERSRQPSTTAAINAYMSGLISAAELDAHRGPGSDPVRPAAPEMRVARPSEARAAARERVRDAYLVPRLAGARARAERAYRDCVGD
jgi:hypothetical protein